MPQLGEITEIYSSAWTKTWLWRIENFFSLPKEPGYVVGSPIFTFEGSTWRLMLFPNGMQERRGLTKIVLSVSARYAETVYWELGIKRQDWTFLKKTYGVRTYQGDQCSEEKSLLVEYEEIVKSSWPHGTGSLAITCKLNLAKAKLTNSSSQTESLSRSDKLADDLKRLLLSGDNSDFKIRVKGKEFRTHKVILGARIPVFSCMFKHQMTESTTGVADIDDCEADIFQIFLQYVYTGTVDDLSLDNVFGVHKVADKYQVEDLKDYCLEFMKDNLSENTYHDVLAVGLRYGEQSLFAEATNFLLTNINDVVATKKGQTSFTTNLDLESNELPMEAPITHPILKHHKNFPVAHVNISRGGDCPHSLKTAEGGQSS